MYRGSIIGVGKGDTRAHIAAQEQGDFLIDSASVSYGNLLDPLVEYMGYVLVCMEWLAHELHAGYWQTPFAVCQSPTMSPLFFFCGAAS